MGDTVAPGTPLEGPRHSGDKAAPTAQSCPSRGGRSWLGAADAGGCRGLPGWARAGRPPAATALRGVQSCRGLWLCECSPGELPCGEPCLGELGERTALPEAPKPHFLPDCAPGDVVAVGRPRACHSGWSADSTVQAWLLQAGRGVREGGLGAALPHTLHVVPRGVFSASRPQSSEEGDACQGQMRCPHPWRPSGGWASGSVSGR